MGNVGIDGCVGPAVGGHGRSEQEMTKAAEELQALRQAWSYDPSVQERVDAALAAFREYADRRARHVALTRAPREEYDDAAVRAADRVRTGAHNAAIAGAADLNRICALTGRDPVAPVPPAGVDPRSAKSHRQAVARYVAEVLELSEEEVAALDL